MKILAIDLGKFKSVTCLFDTTTNQAEYETVVTQRWGFEQLLTKTEPEQVVMETSSVTAWVLKLAKLAALDQIASVYVPNIAQ